jgi:hypothetical protein
MHAIAERGAEKGTVRETFFLSQVVTKYNVAMPKKGDFLVDRQFTFEVGGKHKTKKQIVEIPNSWVVQDDIVFSSGNEIPLWMFGFLY